MPITQDLVGQKFGRLTVIEFKGLDKHRQSLWECLCDCGTAKTICRAPLISGRTRSCGCLQKEKASATLTKYLIKHGESSDRNKLYKTWRNMRQRCNNKKSNDYKYYGGRGITVCSEWDNFLNFKQWALENGYRDLLEIDRIDNSGNYEPFNCRWTTRKEQMRNTRTCKMLSFDGKSVSMVEVAESINMSYGTLRDRIRRGWDIDEAINKGVGNGNKTGYRGVKKYGDRWTARIMLNGKRACLGWFDNPLDASIAYQNAKGEAKRAVT